MNDRIDMIITTKDLHKSVDLYQKVIGFEMRALCNPVLIFKYEMMSFYVYQDSFFIEQFGIKDFDLSGNGMLSVEVKSEDKLIELRDRLIPHETKLFEFVSTSKRYEKSTIVINDLNGLTIRFWINPKNIT